MIPPVSYASIQLLPCNLNPCRLVRKSIGPEKYGMNNYFMLVANYLK